jgi:hypothetical protein
LETPAAKTRQTGIETPPRTILKYPKEQEEEEEYNFDEVQEEPKQNVWIPKTVKRAQDIDQNHTTNGRNRNFYLWIKKDEDEKDTVAGNEIIKDESLSRLRVQEQEYLQEQEETKSEVLLDSTTDSTTGSTMEEMMEKMMERKLKLRIDRVAQVQSNIKEANSKLAQLNTVLTPVTYRIEEAHMVLTTITDWIEEMKTSMQEADEAINTMNTLIQELDEATNSMADFKEAEEVSRADFIRRANDIKTAYGKDAKAVATCIKRAKQTLINSKDKMMTELTSTAPNITSIEVTKKAIEKECQKAIGKLRAKKDRNMENINDKSRSVQDDISTLTRATKEEISTTTKEATEAMDIKLAMILDQSTIAVKLVIKGPDFNTTVQEQINANIKTYPHEMNDAMTKYTGIFFKDNDTLKHYIWDVASSAMEIGSIQEQLEGGSRWFYARYL